MEYSGKLGMEKKYICEDFSNIFILPCSTLQVQCEFPSISFKTFRIFATLSISKLNKNDSHSLPCFSFTSYFPGAYIRKLNITVTRIAKPYGSPNYIKYKR